MTVKKKLFIVECYLDFTKDNGLPMVLQIWKREKERERERLRERERERESRREREIKIDYRWLWNLQVSKMYDDHTPQLN